MNDDYDFDEGLYYDLYGEDEPYDGGNPPGHVDKSRCVFVFDDIHGGREVPLYGRVRVVDIEETFKVRVVNIGEDLRVKVKVFPSECGEWKFVDIAEDFSIKFVDIGEDFTIRFEDK